MSARAGVAQRSHKAAIIASDAYWRERANCRAVGNPNIFTDPASYTEAQLVCVGCPVAAECLRERRGAAGVWGGRVYGESSKQPSTRPYVLSPHGTNAARRRHNRAGEPLCPRCQEG